MRLAAKVLALVGVVSGGVWACKTTSSHSAVKDDGILRDGPGFGGQVMSKNLQVPGHPELSGCYTITLSGSSMHLHLSTGNYDADLVPDTSQPSPAGYPYVEQNSSSPYQAQMAGDTAGAPLVISVRSPQGFITVGSIPPGTNSCAGGNQPIVRDGPGFGGNQPIVRDGPGFGGRGGNNQPVLRDGPGFGGNGGNNQPVLRDGPGFGAQTISKNLYVSGHPELSGCYTITMNGSSMHLHLSNGNYDADLLPDSSQPSPAGYPFVEQNSNSPYQAQMGGDTAGAPLVISVRSPQGFINVGSIPLGSHGC